MQGGHQALAGCHTPTHRLACHLLAAFGARRFFLPAATVAPHLPVEALPLPVNIHYNLQIDWRNCRLNVLRRLLKAQHTFDGFMSYYSLPGMLNVSGRRLISLCAHVTLMALMYWLPLDIMRPRI